MAEFAAAGAEDLRGNVVLVDFWTYTCINWLRTLAYVRAWAEKYGDDGLVVVGVHTPEFPFERDVDNVRQAAQGPARRVSDRARQRLRRLERLRNRYWPAVYIADAEGRIRHHQFGEGGYEECERVIQLLLPTAGHDGVDDDLVSVASGRVRGAGRLGEPRVAGDLPRLRAGPELRVARRRRARRATHVRRAGSAGAQRVGAGRGLDGRTAGKRAERGRAGGSRSASTPATCTRPGPAQSEGRRCRSGS